MKKLLTLTLVTMLPICTFAQITQKLSEFETTWLKPAFPIIAGIVFIIGALTNIGKFFGENRDVKQGVINIVMYLAVVFVIAGIYTAIRSMSL